MNKKVAVFCGAHSGSEKIFSEHAHEVGKLLADAKAELVFGGGNRGLMGIVSDAAIDNGGKVTGIALEKLDTFEKTNPRITTEIITKTFFQRKEKFLEISDAFIVLACQHYKSIANFQEFFFSLKKRFGNDLGCNSWIGLLKCI